MYELTRTDINALRQADSVSFHYNVRVNEGSDERHTFIRAHKRVTEQERERDPFAPYERTHTIDLGSGAEHARMHNYGSDRGPFTAFAMVHSAQVTETWQTAVRSLKVGESIIMHWTRDNSSELTKRASLHVDSLEIAVGAKGKPARRYYVDQRISLDNSARMTRQTTDR